MRNIKRTGIAFLLLMALLSSACGPETVRSYKVKLKDAAAVLNTAAKANHALYEQTHDLNTRVKVATAIHQANEYLIVAINLSKNLTAENFPQNKTQAIQLLTQALSTLASAHIGKPEVDLALQTAVALIREALLIAEAVK